MSRLHVHCPFFLKSMPHGACHPRDGACGDHVICTAQAGQQGLAHLQHRSRPRWGHLPGSSPRQRGPRLGCFCLLEDPLPAWPMVRHAPCGLHRMQPACARVRMSGSTHACLLSVTWASSGDCASAMKVHTGWFQCRLVIIISAC